MSLFQLFFTLLTILALSAGQVLFKLASEDIVFSFKSLPANILNVKLIVALIIYAIATGLWLMVLKVTPLRIAYPFMGLAFIFVPIFARVFLGEVIHWQTFAGALLIGLGIWVSSLY